MPKYPRNYVMIQKKFSDLMKAHEEVGKLAREAGPVDAKTGHLIQLAASVALRSEGGVHSHARRALKAGASKDEIYHTIALLMNTVGFPTIAAAFSWVNDIMARKR
jgi:AhpD family alkylhydroperoxidase